MSLRVDRAELEIVIKNDSSRTKLKELEKQMGDVRKEMRKFREGTPEWEALNRQLRDVTQEYDNMYNSIGLVNLSTRELRNRQRELNSILQNLPPTHPLYNQYRTQLNQVNARLTELRGNAQVTGTSLTQMSNTVSRARGVTAGFIATITGLSYTVKKIAEDTAHLDDVYSDVMKTTGMTRAEVVDLNEAFKKMDTRTAREELNNLASDAGKLGLKGKKEILGFVEAGNQINVALGEDLGEGAIKNIGKIVNVLAKSTKELDAMDLKGRMLAVGSAINELGSNSTASEDYMVSFTGRMGGVAAQADIAVDKILGYASGLDQNMQALEMSATAMQQLIMKIMSEPAKFAKIAGMEVSKFSNLVKTDMNGALIAVLQNLQGKGGLEQLIPIFKEMGLDGARASQVISALAGNIDQVVEAQNIAHQALIEGTSLTKEYETKNNNLQAVLEKSKQGLSDLSIEIGERLTPYIVDATQVGGTLIKTLAVLVGFFFSNAKAILTVVSAIVAYNLILKIQNAYMIVSNTLAAIARIRRIEEALATTQSATAQLFYNRVIQSGSLMTKAYIASTYLLSAAKHLLTLNISKATIAMSRFNAIAKLNPYVLLLLAIPLVFKGISMLNAKFSENGAELERLKEKVKNVSEATEKYTQEIAKEESGQIGLLQAILNTSEGTELRKDLINDLKKEYPDLLKYIDTERLNNHQLLAVLKLVNEEYEKRYEVAAYKGLLSAEEEEINAAKMRQIKVKEILTLIGEGYTISSSTVQAHLNDLNKANGWLDNDIDNISELQKEYGKLSTQIGKSQASAMEYRKSISSLESDASKQNTTGGVMELLNKKANELENQRKWVEDLKTNDFGISEKSKTEAISKLKTLEAEYDILTDKLSGLQKESEKAPDVPPPPSVPTGKGSESSVQKDKINLVLKELEEKHLSEMAAIKKKYADGDIKTEYEYNQLIISQQNKFDDDRKKTISKLLEDKSITDAGARVDLSKQLADIEQKNYDRIIAQNEKVRKILLDADPVEAEKQAYANRLRELGLFNDDVTKRTSEQNEVFKLLEEQHLENMRKLDSKNAKLNLKQLATAQANEENELAVQRNNGLISEQKYKDDLFEIELKYLNEKLKVNGLSADKIEELNKQILDKRKTNTDEKSQTKQSVLEKYNLVTPKDKYQAELDMLKYYEEQGILTHEQATEAKKQIDLQYYDDLSKNAQDSLAAVGQIAGTLSSALSDKQQAEESAIESRYKKEIAAAGNNSKKVAKLEAEKEAAIHAVRAKYADKQFILTVAQVISSTAVAAMEAYKAMAGIPVVGPALGAIASGAAIAAGAAQIQVAKEQQESAKKGYKTGGYTTGGGSDSDEAGVVHKNEFVATADAVRNPEVKKFLDVFDVAQKTGTIKMLNTTSILDKVRRTGFQTGGYTTPPTQSSQSDTMFSSALNIIKENTSVIQRLNNQIEGGIHANVQISGKKGLSKKLAEYNSMMSDVSR